MRKHLRITHVMIPLLVMVCCITSTTAVSSAAEIMHRPEFSSSMNQALSLRQNLEKSPNSFLGEREGQQNAKATLANASQEAIHVEHGRAILSLTSDAEPTKAQNAIVTGSEAGGANINELPVSTIDTNCITTEPATTSIQAASPSTTTSSLSQHFIEWEPKAPFGVGYAGLQGVTTETESFFTTAEETTTMRSAPGPTAPEEQTSGTSSFEHTTAFESTTSKITTPAGVISSTTSIIPAQTTTSIGAIPGVCTPVTILLELVCFGVPPLTGAVYLLPAPFEAIEIIVPAGAWPPIGPGAGSELCVSVFELPNISMPGPSCGPAIDLRPHGLRPWKPIILQMPCAVPNSTKGLRPTIYGFELANNSAVCNNFTLAYNLPMLNSTNTTAVAEITKLGPEAAFLVPPVESSSPFSIGLILGIAFAAFLCLVICCVSCCYMFKYAKKKNKKEAAGTRRLSQACTSVDAELVYPSAFPENWDRARNNKFKITAELGFSQGAQLSGVVEDEAARSRRRSLVTTHVLLDVNSADARRRSLVQ